MTAYLLALALLLITLVFISLRKTYYFFPARELKRQARMGDRDATILYRAVAYGSSLRLLLWFVIGLCVAGSFLLLQVAAPAWLVFAALATLIWYAFAWSPNAAVSGVGARMALLLTPLIAKTMYYLHPSLDSISRFIERHRPVIFHTGLFEREDLVELIEQQRQLSDSRISHDELSLALHALTFGDKQTAAVMVPKRDVITVRESDIIGPILMDELYESKFSRYPVLASNSDAIVGTLYLRDLVSAKHGGTVHEVMRDRVMYVHEDQTLYQVLHAFLTTKHQLFVVINNSEEYVGIITIDDVLEQIIGHKVESDFDSYDDPRAVAQVPQVSNEATVAPGDAALAVVE
jgi:CBS domain containing-hemolysin-like protein